VQEHHDDNEDTELQAGANLSQKENTLQVVPLMHSNFTLDTQAGQITRHLMSLDLYQAKQIAQTTKADTLDTLLIKKKHNHHIFTEADKLILVKQSKIPEAVLDNLELYVLKLSIDMPKVPLFFLNFYRARSNKLTVEGMELNELNK
jgi:hypothetical protein